MQTRRAFAAALLAASAVTGVTACTTSSSGSNTTAAAQLGKITVPHPVAGFARKAVWKASGVASDVPPVVSSAGVVVTTSKDGAYKVSMLNASTGKLQWSSDTISDADGAPTVVATTQAGRPYVVVWVPGDHASAHLMTFDGYGVATPAKPTVDINVTPKTAGTPPTLAVTPNGVLVSGAKSPSAVFTVDLGSGGIVSYGKSPLFNGTTNGTPVAMSNGAFLVSYGDKGYVMAAGSRAASWTSASITPKNAKPGTGTLLAVGDSVVLSRWEATSGGNLVVAQAASNGQVFAIAPTTDTPQPDFTGKTPIRLAFDGAWATWGKYAFDLHAGTGKTLAALDDVTVGMVVRSVVYGNRGPVPVTVNLPAAPDDVTKVSMAGVGMTSANMGLFVDGDSVYSIPVS